MRRDMLDLPKRRGRHPGLSEEQDTELWRRWEPEFKTRGIALDDSLSMLELTLDLAEALDLPASVLWSTIQGWIDQGLV